MRLGALVSIEVIPYGCICLVLSDEITLKYELALFLLLLITNFSQVFLGFFFVDDHLLNLYFDTFLVLIGAPGGGVDDISALVFRMSHEFFLDLSHDRFLLLVQFHLGEHLGLVVAAERYNKSDRLIKRGLKANEQLRLLELEALVAAVTSSHVEINLLLVGCRCLAVVSIREPLTR